MTAARKERLEQLLRLAGEGLTNPARDSIRGGDGALMLLPHSRHCLIRTTRPAVCTCWIKSLQELERCLRRMRLEHRSLWHALHLRYIVAERRPMLIKVRDGRPVLEPNMLALNAITRTGVNQWGNGTTRILVEQWHPDVNADRVLEALGTLSVLFQGSPDTPPELPFYRAAA